jgi:hypothetical protein
MDMGTRQLRALLGLKSGNAPQNISRAKLIYAGLLAHSATFTLCNPLLPALLALIQAAEAAQDAVGTHTTGLADTRTVALKAMIAGLKLEQAYVNSLCATATPEEATAIITSAGMKIAKNTTYVKLPLSGKLQVGTGAITLHANAKLLRAGSKKAVVYNWRGSANNGATWVQYNPTGISHITITGLTLLTQYIFEVSITIGDGAPSAWGQAYTILVH